MMNSEKAPAPIMGLVLAGGRSRRMGRDKATLLWRGQPLWRQQAGRLAAAGLPAAISVRAGQSLEAGALPLVSDSVAEAGPLAGFLSAWERFPGHALLAVACDLPLLDAETLRFLVEHRDANKTATAFRSAHDGLPEPLCAIWEPVACVRLEQSLRENRPCPRKALIHEGEAVRLLDLPRPLALENANTPEEWERLAAIDHAEGAPA